jgi:hypothetical protein
VLWGVWLADACAGTCCGRRQCGWGLWLLRTQSMLYPAPQAGYVSLNGMCIVQLLVARGVR